jgi:hypothetical protein
MRARQPVTPGNPAWEEFSDRERDDLGRFFTALRQLKEQLWSDQHGMSAPGAE